MHIEELLAIRKMSKIFFYQIYDLQIWVLVHSNLPNLCLFF